MLKVLLAAALLALLAPAAAAAQVTRSGDTLTVAGGDGSDQYTFTEAGGAIVIQVHGAALAPGPCTLVAGDDVSCANAAQIERVVVDTGAGFDSVEVTTLDAVLEADLGADSDMSFATAAARRVVVRGGPGRELMQGGAAADLLDGGAGRDTLRPSPGSDELIGGPDVDLLQLNTPGTGVTASFDDVANDGLGAGGTGNYHADIEDVLGDATARDVIVATPTDNVLDTGGGDDVIDGGGGYDTMIARDGDDVLRARDGLAERVDCGEGADTAVVDDIDVTVECEAVDASSDVRPDVDGDGARKPGDCDDASPAIRPGAAEVPENGVDEDCDGADAVVLDRDGDGVPRPLDCDDTRADVRPGSRERFGNRIDENCDGRAEPFPTLGAKLAWRVDAFPTYTVVTRLRLTGLRRGERVTVRCDARGCPFERRRYKAPKRGGELDVRGRFAGRRLRGDAQLAITVQDRRGVRKRFRLDLEPNGLSIQTVRCASPPDGALRRC